MLITEFFNNNFSLSTITEDMADIITARELIEQTMIDPTLNKHKYFEFLKNLRERQGADYSTSVHKSAAKLAKHKGQH